MPTVGTGDIARTVNKRPQNGVCILAFYEDRHTIGNSDKRKYCIAFYTWNIYIYTETHKYICIVYIYKCVCIMCVYMYNVYIKYIKYLNILLKVYKILENDKYYRENIRGIMHKGGGGG